MAGVIDGSFDNEHPSRAIRIVEVAVKSSSGTRVFKFACLLGPQETKDFALETGFRLDFRDMPKSGWWNLMVTRATWGDGPGGQMRCPEPPEK